MQLMAHRSYKYYYNKLHEMLRIKGKISSDELKQALIDLFLTDIDEPMLNLSAGSHLKAIRTTNSVHAILSFALSSIHTAIGTCPHLKRDFTEEEICKTVQFLRLMVLDMYNEHVISSISKQAKNFEDMKLATDLLLVILSEQVDHYDLEKMINDYADEIGIATNII